jgi:hypothetical protein
MVLYETVDAEITCVHKEMARFVNDTKELSLLSN